MSSNRTARIISPNGTFDIATFLSTIAFSIVMSSLFLFAALPPAFSQLATNNDNINTENGTLSATGVSEVEVRPDKVVLTFAVETTAETATDALNENNQRINDILEALEEVGVTENQTSTAQFMISPIYEVMDNDQLDSGVVEDGAIEAFPPPAPNQQGRNIIGYRVTNAIQLETFEISNISSIIDTAVHAGADRIDNLFFTVSDERSMEIREQLITDAIENAREKADTAADALNVHIVGVESASIQEGFIIPQTTFREATAAVSAIPILPGEQDISTTVNVTYLIESEG